MFSKLNIGAGPSVKEDVKHREAKALEGYWDGESNNERDSTYCGAMIPVVCIATIFFLKMYPVTVSCNQSAF